MHAQQAPFTSQTPQAYHNHAGGIGKKGEERWQKPYDTHARHAVTQSKRVNHTHAPTQSTYACMQAQPGAASAGRVASPACPDDTD